MRFLTLLLVLAACNSTPKASLNPPDENLWLEEIQGEKSLAWVKEQNAITESQLENLPAYKQNEADIKKIVLAEDRLPGIVQMGKYVYNFWQDGTHVRGVWRRTTLADYRKLRPKWESVLDVDALSKKETENWVYKGADCLPPEYELCLLTLSRGGKDLSVVREFNTLKKEFVKDGFVLPEARSSSAWLNKDTLLAATDYGPGSLTRSSYPRVVKIWKRGQPLNAAVSLLEGTTDDMNAWAATLFTPKGVKVLVGRNLNFYEDVVYEMTPDHKLKPIEKPKDAQYAGWLNGQDILHLRSDWVVRGETFPSGSLIALPPVGQAQPKMIFAPSARQSIKSIEQTKDALIINYLDTVQSRLARAYPKGDAWVFENLPFPEKGDLALTYVDPYGDLLITMFQNFLTPNSLLMARAGLDVKAENVKPVTLKASPKRFDATRFKIEQLWAQSADGTPVPYFLISAKNIKADGETPTLIYGYGGFEISQSPSYLSTVGKVWLEKGGAYVLANIRGGGEFGPAWHQAALKENRQRAYDDFIAVGEDLVKRKVSSPRKMAIYGGSNGGLLVGATFVERPDLFAAVICKVPLLDMLRYNQLLAGASWEAEYGDPNDPKLRPAILKYSPYQNVKPGVKYPEVFFITSTMDDRVHPGHARKMVARMKAQGHPLLYWENTEGGHSAAANLLQRVKFSSLEYTFLQDRLLKKQ